MPHDDAASARLLGLDIAQADRPGVVADLDRLRIQAALVLAFALPIPAPPAAFEP